MQRQRYTYTRKDGTTNKPVGLTFLMLAAARRIITGKGPFTVTREPAYNHPGLVRGSALRMVRAIALKMERGEHCRTTAKDGTVVFRFARVKNTPLYENPLRDCVGLRGLRQDQGVDYSVAQDSLVYAIGPGVVTIYRTTSGWPWDATNPDGGAYIAYKLTAGPARGLYVYDVEHIKLNPKLQVGSLVDSSTVIATHLPGFANCEMGWASAASNGYSPEASGCYTEGLRTGAGVNFDLLMRELGAPPGLTEGRPVSCPLSSKYPKTWKGLL